MTLALIGWAAGMLVGAYLLLAGAYLCWMTTVFGGKVERPAVFVAVFGALVLYLFATAAPFNLSFTPSVAGAPS